MKYILIYYFYTFHAVAPSMEQFATKEQCQQVLEYLESHKKFGQEDWNHTAKSSAFYQAECVELK